MGRAIPPIVILTKEGSQTKLVINVVFPAPGSFAWLRMTIGEQSPSAPIVILTEEGSRTKLVSSDVFPAPRILRVAQDDNGRAQYASLADIPSANFP
jgi:hypothetical protein